MTWLKRQPEQIYGLELKRLIKAGIVNVKPRAASVQGTAIHFEDHSSVQAENVIWGTGFRADYGWINIPGALDAAGFPIHEKGVSPVGGLYFLGLPWMSRRGSALMGWVGQDARRLLDRIGTCHDSHSEGLLKNILT